MNDRQGSHGHHGMERTSKVVLALVKKTSNCSTSLPVFHVIVNESVGCSIRGRCRSEVLFILKLTVASPAWPVVNTFQGQNSEVMLPLICFL